MLKTESSWLMWYHQQRLTGFRVMGSLILLAAILLLSTIVVQSGNRTEVPVLYLPIVNETLQLTSNVIVESDGSIVETVRLTVANIARENRVTLDPASLSVRYRDEQQRIAALPWTWNFQGSHNGDNVLDPGERVQLKVNLADTLSTPLTTNSLFILELKPSNGAILSVHRTTPSTLSSLIDLQ